MTPERHQRFEAWTGLKLRVLLDGFDVTNECQQASAEEGWVKLLQRGPGYKFFYDQENRCAAHRFFFGTVTFRVERSLDGRN